MGHEDHKYEHHLESRKEAAHQFKHHRRHKRPAVLPVQGGYLAVYHVEASAVLVDKPPHALLYPRHMSYDAHYPYRHAFLVSGDEEPQSQQTEHADNGKHRRHCRIEWLSDDVKDYRQEPEPEVTEDVSHDIQYHRRRCTLRSYLRCQLHYTVRFAAHKSAGRGIIKGEAGHRYLVKPPEAYLVFPVAAASYNKVPRCRVYDIQRRPQSYHGKEPEACTTDTVIHFGKVELRHHYRQQHDAENEEYVLMLHFE